MSPDPPENEQAFLQAVRNPEFLAELHKLFWLKPHDNFGTWDPGWSCRDHAAVLAAIAGLNRIEVEVVSGKCVYGMRRLGHKDFKMVGQDVSDSGGHAWIRLPSLGMIDVSPNIPFFTELWGPDAGKFAGIFSGKYEPSEAGKVIYCTTATDYAQAIADATYTEGVMNAIYWEAGCAPFRIDSIDDPYTEIDSPLTHVLRRNFPKSIYAKAVLHLRDRSVGKGRSVAGLSHKKAWTVVSEKLY